MPDRGLRGSPPRVVADLRVEISDARGQTTAHLSSEPAGLVLDVGDPVVLLRAVPGRGVRRDLPVQVPRKLLVDLPVRFRSRGRDLGEVHVSATGGVRWSPTPAGVLVAARTALTYGRTPYVVEVVLLAAALISWVTRRR